MTNTANNFKEDIRVSFPVFVFTGEVHGHVVDVIKNFTATCKTAPSNEEEGSCSWSDSELYITV